MKKFIYLLPFLVLFVSLSVQSATTVLDTFEMDSGSGATDTFTLGTLLLEEDTGDEDNPHQVFIPIALTAATAATDIAHDLSTFGAGASSTSSVVTIIPYINRNGVGGGVANFANSKPYISFTVNHDLGSSEDILVGVETSDGSGTYKMITISDAETVDKCTSTDSCGITMSLYDLCNSGGCDFITEGTTSTSDSIKVYFATGTDPGPGQEIDLDTATDGVFVEFNLNNNVDSASVVPDLRSIKRGDGNVTLNFNGSDVTGGGTNHYRTWVVQVPAGQSGGNTYRNALLNNFTFDSSLTTETSGDIFVENFKNVSLVNGTTYQFAIAIENKYQFVSYLSQALSVTPEEITAFLNEQSCYLISAGFKESHPVLNYFRGFRDSFLYRYKLGSSFVHWYYQTAPKYGKIIYNSPILSKISRGLSHWLYFLMNGRFRI